LTKLTNHRHNGKGDGPKKGIAWSSDSEGSQNVVSLATPWGIDVSHHNGDIDWSMVKQAGAEFAFLKATEGATFVDKTFKANWKEAKASGIRVGAYHFFRPRIALQSQIDNFVRALGSVEAGDLPPVIDTEVPSDWAKLTGKQSVDLIVGFIDGIRAKLGDNVHPIIYLSPSFADDVLKNDARLKDHPLWLAHYTSASRPRVPKPWDFWTFWQFTENGKVAGISGNVDINRFNGQSDRLEALLVK
jgi:lysozyme